MDEFGDTDPLLEHSDGDDDDDEVRPQVVPPAVYCVPVSRYVSWSLVFTLHKFRFHYPCRCYQGEILCESLSWQFWCTSVSLDQ